MITPTIKVGGELIWLDAKALKNHEVKLDRESISEQCDGCGRDILETGEIKAAGEVNCSECGASYPIVVRDVS